jgi:uncharacterized coiled-coil protein SlyX
MGKAIFGYMKMNKKEIKGKTTRKVFTGSKLFEIFGIFVDDRVEIEAEEEVAREQECHIGRTQQSVVEKSSSSEEERPHVQVNWKEGEMLKKAKAAQKESSSSRFGLRDDDTDYDPTADLNPRKRQREAGLSRSQPSKKTKETTPKPTPQDVFRETVGVDDEHVFVKKIPSPPKSRHKFVSSSSSSGPVKRRRTILPSLTIGRSYKAKETAGDKSKSIGKEKEGVPHYIPDEEYVPADINQDQDRVFDLELQNSAQKADIEGLSEVIMVQDSKIYELNRTLHEVLSTLKKLQAQINRKQDKVDQGGDDGNNDGYDDCHTPTGGRIPKARRARLDMRTHVHSK